MGHINLKGGTSTRSSQLAAGSSWISPPGFPASPPATRRGTKASRHNPARHQVGCRIILLGSACCWLALGLGAGGKAHGADRTTRSLSLNECIQMALQHNLDLQIEHHAPAAARYRLSASYGVYEPILTLDASSSFVSQPLLVDPKKSGTDFPYELTTDSFKSGLSGKLPTGLSYNLGGQSDRLDARTDFRSSPGTAANFPPTGIRFTNEYILAAGLALRQPLLKNAWIDADRLLIQVNKKDLKISELNLSGKIMATITTVEINFYELVYARENMQVLRAALERTQRLLLDTQNKLHVGAVPPLEEKLVQSQVETAKSEIAAGEQAVKERQDALRNLFVEDLKEWADVSLEPAESLKIVFEPFDRTESWQNAMTKRPDLLQLRVDLEKQDIVLRYDRNQLFPTLDLVGGYGWTAAQSGWDAAGSDLGSGRYPVYSYGVILSIPLGGRSARNTYKAGQEAKIQSLLRLKKLEIDIMTQVEDTGKLVQTSYERVDSTRKAREYAELALQNEESKLQNGQSTTFLVLEFQRRLSAARSAELRSLADHNRARAQLALSEGVTLEKNNITLNFR